MLDGINHPFLSGLLIGAGITGILVAGIFWMDRILDFHWRRKRR